MYQLTIRKTRFNNKQYLLLRKQFQFKSNTVYNNGTHFPLSKETKDNTPRAHSVG